MLYTATEPLAFPTYRVDPLTASAVGELRSPPVAICVGELQPDVVDWLQVLVEITVSELLESLATNTFPAVASRTTASGPEPDPVDTEAAATKSDGLLVLPSPSTLTLLLDLSAM